MRTNKLSLFLSGLMAMLVFSGCADPLSMILMMGMGDRKTSESKPSKLICSNGVAKIDGDSAGIIGGQILEKDTWLAKGIVFIIQVSRDPETGKKSKFMCTGTLVDDNVVLTAAHCVDQARDNYRTDLIVYFTNQPECDMTTGNLLSESAKVTGLKVHPDWISESEPRGRTPRSVRGDLALIRLAGKAPVGWKPLKLTSQFIEMAPAGSVVLSGYGHTNVDYRGAYSVDDSDGILLRVTQVHPVTTEMAQALGANRAENEMLYIDQSGGTGVCAGDSGGPSLMRNSEGKFVVTGVASQISGEQGRACGYVAAHTSIIRHRAWLEESFGMLRDESSTKNSLFE